VDALTDTVDTADKVTALEKRIAATLCQFGDPRVFPSDLISLPSACSQAESL
jgi:hypothetical protein